MCNKTLLKNTKAIKLINIVQNYEKLKKKPSKSPKSSNTITTYIHSLLVSSVELSHFLVIVSSTRTFLRTCFYYSLMFGCCSFNSFPSSQSSSTCRVRSNSIKSIRSQLPNY